MPTFPDNPQTLAQFLETLKAEMDRLAKLGVTPEQIEFRIRDASAGEHHEITDLHTTDASEEGETKHGMLCRMLLSF
jgi:hypothetical protein